MVHTIGNEKEKQLVDELKARGITLYSVSRLNSFNTCKAEYYQTYVNRNRGEQNVYTETGTFIHEYLERVYRGEIEDTSDFKRKLNSKLFRLEVAEMYFPNETIEKAWKADMEHFCDNFEKLDGDFTIEKMYIAQFGDNYLYGFIDAIREIDDEVQVLDWKTSSKFSGEKKLTHAGRQLLVYKLGLEQKGLKVDKVMWNMLKYCYVCWKQKNGKIKKKMVNRGKLIKDMRKNFEKVMLASNMDEIEIDMILMQAEAKNDFEVLPQVVKDMYWVEDCLLEYEVTDERLEEVEKYVTETIAEIESMDFNDESEWTPLNLDKENFYCNTLCSHRDTCPYLAEWKRKNPFKKIGF